MLQVRDLRKMFTDYFRGKGHRIVPSSSLVPKDDPTLLFTTAGMVQFKPMFTGSVELEYTRASTIQKCLRTSDLEQVGKTKRHLTFFEMLGNFSFGDYFKKDAIGFAWDFSINVIKFPKEKIWVSIYENDDEAFNIWNTAIGIPAEKIVRLGKKDNFWGPAGETGACGPCSELYIDRGEKFGCGSPSCRPGCDCERFLEYWNLVFVQFNQDAEKNLNPLAKPGIDTGMGLERLALLVQNADSIYETDEMASLVKFVSDQTGVKYEGKNEVPIKVIVEHSRALTFAMSDGVYPSNDGRGYVLRRVLRRALRFTRQLGVHEPFLHRMVDPIVNLMGQFYPGIMSSRENVKSVILSEEKRFLETLDNGMDRLDEIMKACRASGGKTIPGRDAFVLYDTFGFPLEMTTEIAEENGLAVDLAGFEKEMDIQRERGKQSWKGSDAGFAKIFDVIASAAGDSEFTGYTETISSAAVRLLFRDNAGVQRLGTGDRGLLVLDRTPFYGESGGQTGDTGTIESASGALFRVDDTKKHNHTHIHVGEVIKGEFKTGDAVTAAIDEVRRNCIRANHTATHLLQGALVRILGKHVKQAGSLVTPERFRFDFTHFNAMSDDEIARAENMVNERIWENTGVNTEVLDLNDAIKKGATAVFDEKYEDKVRVVKVGDFSMELCGGTHVFSTGEVGVFKILKESSPGAGMRRIEAITLKGIYERISHDEALIARLNSALNISGEDIIKRVEDLVEKNRSLEKEMARIKKESLSSDVDSIIAAGIEVRGINVISHLFSGVDVDQLRALSDAIRSRDQNSVVCFGSDFEGKALLLCAATNNSVSKGVDCGKIIKENVKTVEGGGGGRKDMAQAGGKAPQHLRKALDGCIKQVTGMIK